MSERVYGKLVAMCPGVASVELEKPIVCTTVGGDLEVTRAVNVHITLRAAAGPVSIGSPVKCLIVPGDLEESLLGKEMLVSIGIDVDRELEMLAFQGQQEDSEESDEPEVSSTPEMELWWRKLSSAGFRLTI
ncbi:hypothetical protein PF005_g26134 [Phytophthora fragariae]|nr:hypothetical protein PF007_g27402 [Phytophthora fragariae]KAE9173770.1 hypothetical protein PF005_g26134 [Phytophthora fragariae]KAE9205967.1 hypothetical protein PF002_g20157 [Phytophthora fragariae]